MSIAVILASLVAILVVIRCVQPSSLVITGLTALWLAFAATIGWFHFQPDRVAVAPQGSVVAEEQTGRGMPEVVKTNGYVGSEACAGCHSGQHASWHNSYHRTMTQVASTQSVLGDFRDPTLPDAGLPFEIHLRQQGEQFHLLMEAPDGSRQEMPIVLTTGSHHMQVYWFSVDPSTSVLGILPYAFLRKEGRWVPRHSAFLRPPQAIATNELGRWNLVCIQCHTTHGRPGITHYDDPDHVYYDKVKSQVAEFGISCEACHGPGEEHVRDHQLIAGAGEADDVAQLVNPAELSHTRSAAVCGQCHGVFELKSETWEQWNRQGHDFRPGNLLSNNDTRKLVTCCEGVVLLNDENESAEFADWMSLFWSDGMIRVRGREYTALVENPCFQRGEMSCVTCHQLHQLATDPRPADEWADDQLKHGLESGNAACVQCHSEYVDAERLAKHSHHAANSSGSHCYNCHMPHTTYGLLKAIRSHQIDSPDVATTLATGRPNACNQCHLDKTLKWTAEALAEWYGHSQPVLSEDQQTIAASILWLLRGDAGQRALTAWTYGWKEAQLASGTAWMPLILVPLLNDPYDAVRYIAAQSLRKLDGYEEIPYDFLGSPADSERALQYVLERWQQREPLSVSSNRELLLDSDGDVILSQIQRLLQQRDDRKIYLAE